MFQQSKDSKIEISFNLLSTRVSAKKFPNGHCVLCMYVCVGLE